MSELSTVAQVATTLRDRGLSDATACYWLEARQFRADWYTALWLIESGDAAEVLDAAGKVEAGWTGAPYRSTSTWAIQPEGAK